MSKKKQLILSKEHYKRYRLSFIVLGGLVIGLFIFMVLSIGIGPVSIHPFSVIKILMSKLWLPLGEDELVQSTAIIYGIRLPRLILAVLIGAALAVSGASLQGLFRNPLADPGLIGVSSGAALAAASVIIVIGPALANKISPFLQSALLPVAAFSGGLLATWVVYRISAQQGRTSVSTMLLAGVAINAIAAAGIGYLVFTADDNQIRNLTFWTLGSLGGSVWTAVYVASPFLLLSIIGLPLFSKKMNAMLLGEQEARHLGVNTERIKKIIIVLAALGVGAAVSVSGVIGFIGLVVPHLLRLVIGPDHRFLMPGSVLLGALMLLGSDLIARMIVIPAELPIGVVTSTIGAPFFLWLLMRNRSLSNYL